MRDPAPWQKRYDQMLLIAIALGLFGQYLFVGREAGISVPLFVLGFYGLFFYAVKGRIGGFDRWRGQSKSGWLLFIPVALLSIAYLIYANPLFRVMNGLMLFALIVFQTMLLTRGGSQPWHRLKFYGESLLQWLVAPLTHMAVPIGIVAGWMKLGGGKPSETRSRISKIVVGLIIAAPLMIIVIALLASADGIFHSWVNGIPSWVDGVLFGNGMARLIVGCGIALYTFCYIWGLLFRKQQQIGAGFAAMPEGNSRQPIQYIIDPITASTVLICANIVYVLFVSIQFTYLFGAAGGLLPEGTPYAEYARRGFAELVLVALLNMGLLLGGLHFVAKASPALERLRRVLLSLLMGCTVVMLISAYSRLALYEEAYGYTHLRLLVHGFMVLLGIMMTVALARIWYGRFSLAKIYIALLVAAYVIMNYANLDATIAVNNMERFERTGDIDISYLGTLSADAAPALLELYKRYPELEGLEAVIDRLHQRGEDRMKHWQSWNLAEHRLKQMTQSLNK